MWIVVPLVPVLIAILLISMGLIGGLQDIIYTVGDVLIVIIVIVFIAIAICNIRTKMAVLRKVFSVISCIASSAISAFVIRILVKTLAEIELGIFGYVEFVFVLFFGGLIAFMIVLGCFYACCWFGDILN